MNSKSSNGYSPLSTQSTDSKNRVAWLKGGVALLAFMLSGPSLIMTNKTLTLFTLCFSSFSCILFVHTFGIELKHSKTVTPKFYIETVMPIGFLTAGTIVMGMVSYLFLTVSFIQMLKAFTPVMTLGFLVMAKLDKPSRSILGSVLVICLGTAVAGSGEMNFSLVGVLCMITAQVCEALRLVFTQIMLQNLKFNVLETLYYVTPACALWVFIAAMLAEIPYMDESVVEKFFAHKHLFVASGLLALSTNIVNWYVIQIADALMLKLLATARNALLVLFNAVFLSEIVTHVQGLGYGVSLAGFMAYNYYKIKEKESKHRSNSLDRDCKKRESDGPKKEQTFSSSKV
eukprot:CAMPEP_0184061414 /NCGR_PEP_ID=MMETSP0956-20121227/11481_1 /TAXON_ID=627963 /ORGANISM="Aplanochytrium sp, Strain PBS07" /LENGTH=343 /DNA_ID=CAMNT_0026357871 /DNA_START=115 /DNA_END=1146 /DNA_ORIENTATION=-